MFSIYYINLASRADRREYMETQLTKLGLTAQRIEAVTPAELSALDIEQYCNPQKPTFLRQTELSCTLSHERAWQAMLETDADRALILEDDVELSRLLPAFLEDARAIDADLIRVETTGNATRVFPITSTGKSGVAVRPFRSTPTGSAGYLIRASAARSMLGSVALRQRHMDLALYSPFEEPGSLLTRVLTDPAMCRQLNMTEQKSVELARSDIAYNQTPHAFAEVHPVRFFVHKFQRNLRRGWRNARDHVAQQKNGLERRVIPFGG